MKMKEFEKVVRTFLDKFCRTHDLKYHLGDMMFQHWFKVIVDIGNEGKRNLRFVISFDEHELCPRKSAWKVVDITERKPVVDGLMTLKIQQMWEAGL